jgi:sugar lactone lactonase YvrE
VLGAEDVAFLDGQLYAAADGGGPVHGNPDLPSGIYRADADGTVTVVADLSAWLRANPVAVEPPDYDPDADGYRMVADEAAGVLWVLEPNAGGVLTVTPDGTVTRVVDLSADHPVPSAIALAPEGGAVYVGTLTAVPYPNGEAKVMKITTDGTVTDVWTGLTVVTGVAVGPDGTLYAAELSTNNLTEPPFLVPGTGKVVRQTGPDSSEEIATGLMLPIALGFGPDGGLYYSSPAIGANEGQGVIIRLDVAGMATSSAASETAATPTCEPVPGTIAAP